MLSNEPEAGEDEQDYVIHALFATFPVSDAFLFGRSIFNHDPEETVCMQGTQTERGVIKQLKTAS